MSNQPKKFFSRSNLIYGSIIALLLFITFDGNAKALVIQGLMKAGLFRTHIPINNKKIDKSYNYDAADFREMVFQGSEGQTFNLSSLKGKVIFINFWATWCPPCRAELPSINKLYKNFKNNNRIKFLMVDVDGKYKSSVKFMERHHWDLPVYTVEGDIPPVYLNGAIPATVILDKNGTMVVNHVGAANYDTRDIEKGLEQLINN